MPPAANANSDWASWLGPWPGLDRRERVQPVLDPAVDVRFEGADGEGAQRGQQQTDRDPAGAARGDVQQDHEEPEEEERGAEVAFQDEYADAEQPDRDDRAEDPPGGQLERLSRQIWRPVYASAFRLAARYAAKNTASRTFANSPGWKENPAIRIQIRAPFTAGKKIGRMSRTRAAATQTYAYRWRTRWSRSRTTTTMNSATPTVDQTSWAGAARSPGVSRSSR